MLSLKDREWKPFSVIDIFDEVERGKRLKKNDHVEGKRPYVSSSAKNNGVDQFIGNTEKVRTFKNCLSLANSGSVGACFYEPFEFVASDHITHLQRAGTSQYIYLFMATTISRLSEKYDFNREINDYRISREKIMLPVTDLGEPDYQFMEEYMKALILKKRKQYQCYVEDKIARICGGGPMNYWMMWVELKILIGNLFLSYHYLQDWSQEKAKVLITYHNQVREYRISVQQIEIMVLFVM